MLGYQLHRASKAEECLQPKDCYGIPPVLSLPEPTEGASQAYILQDQGTKLEGKKINGKIRLIICNLGLNSDPIPFRKYITSRL